MFCESFAVGSSISQSHIVLGRFLRENLDREGQNLQHEYGITTLKCRAKHHLLTEDFLKVQVPSACRNAVLCRRVEASNTLRVLGVFNNLNSV